MSHLDYKEIKNNNSGFSFLFVIFGVIFIAAIGVIALTMATNYYITTTVDEKSTEQFYTTEAILQEIRTGLGEYANDLKIFVLIITQIDIYCANRYG